MRGNTRRSAQRGSLRGCCCGSLLAGIIIATGLLALNLSVVPPGVLPSPGPAPGATTAAVEGYATAEISSLLSASGQARIVLTDADLTVIAQSEAPASLKGQSLQVTTYDDEIVIAAHSSIGPLGVWKAAYFSLTSGSSLALVGLTLVTVRMGRFSLPHGLDTLLGKSFPQQIDFRSLFSGNAALSLLTGDLDCAGVTPSGVVLWVHSPLVPANAGLCG